MQVGLQDENQLFLCLFLNNEEFSRPNIEAAIQLLTEQFDLIGA